jgi:hypothetical protein
LGGGWCRFPTLAARRLVKASTKDATRVILVQAGVTFSLNLALGGRHYTFDAARRLWVENVIFHGKLDMKRFGSRSFWQAITVAGAGAALMMSVSAGNAQSGGPFASFDGSWAGNGTVSLSDGSKESIRCRATNKVGGGGNALKLSLRCASDSYKFDLTSDVSQQGDRITGSWSETSRNINGNLQGTAGGGRMDVFVEAAGFAATLTLVTSGNKQQVSISSKGEIRGVAISMVRS